MVNFFCERRLSDRRTGSAGKRFPSGSRSRSRSRPLGTPLVWENLTPFVLKQNQAVGQRQRFSQVRFGSQVDLIVPLSARFDFDTVAEIGDHVKAGIDPIIKVTEKMELR